MSILINIYAYFMSVFSAFWADECGSTSLSVAAIASFGGEVKHAYQDGGMLRDTVRIKTGVIGLTHRFNKLGAGAATPRVPQTDIIPMNLVHTNQNVTLENWNAAEYTDVFDDAATNISERGELAQTIAKAIGRREDQMIIDALEAASTTLTVASSIGGANTDLNVAKVRRANRMLGDQGMEGEMLSFIGSHFGKEAMLGQTEVTSADFNSVRALVSGEVNSFIGFDFKWIASNRGEGGLDLTAGDRTCFAYGQSAMGYAISGLQRMEVNYIPTKTSWLANFLFRGNAIDIDALGIVEITTDENG